MSASSRQKGTPEMTPVQAAAAEAPVKVATTCLPTDRLPVGIEQAIGDHRKQSILQGSLIFRLDMYLV